MGLTSWDGSPEGKIHKLDVIIAKNYLSNFEMEQLQRIVLYKMNYFFLIMINIFWNLKIL